MNQPKAIQEQEQPVSLFKLKGMTLTNMFSLAHYFSFFTKTAFFNKNYFFQVDSKFFIKAYTTRFLQKLLHVTFKAKNSSFFYFIIKETRKQSFITLLGHNKRSYVTYSTGLLLCAMGFKKNNVYRAMKKQNQGFIKGLTFSKMYVLPKFLKSSETNKKTIGIVIKGRGKFTPSFSELPRYFNKLKTKTLFMLWIPKVRFSYVKFRQYGRIKRNLRKRIVKTLTLSERIKRQPSYVNVS